MKIPSEAELIEMEQRFDWMADYDPQHTEDFRALVEIARAVNRNIEAWPNTIPSSPGPLRAR